IVLFEYYDIFDATTNDQFEDCVVRVFLKRSPENWVYIKEGLEAETSVQESSCQNLNAFNLLMKKVGWKNAIHNTIGKSFIERLTAALWYIDPHRSKFIARSLSLGELFNNLNQYQKDQHYNFFYDTGKHAKTNLKRDKLEQLASSLELSVVQPWATNDNWNWETIINEVFVLISSMQKYAKNLEQINQVMKEIHISDTLARQPANDLKVYTIEPCQKINIKYQQLRNFLSNTNDYIEINLERFLPEDTIQCYHYIRSLQIHFPVTLYHYYQGNYLGTINYIWKIPVDFEDRSETAQARVMAAIQERLPQYFSRQMRKNVLKKYSLIQTVTPAVLRVLYHNLTGDAAVTSNKITIEDPSIICDLYQNNGFKGTKFDLFWSELEAYFNEQLMIVDMDYMPLAISSISEPILIPSEEWIRLQFQPTNPTNEKAKQYTGRFNIKFMVQARLLRKNHPDIHYLPIGESVNTSTGIHNKKFIVFQETSLVACDHDFTKLSLTPFVIFFCNIPQSIEESFYSGKVFVSFKDTVFHPSNAIRHATEFYHVISTNCFNIIPPILCLYTDSGPDHRIVFSSVQISLICLFLHGNFDMLIAMRTAPYHSWTNPAERIMSILNLGLQGVALVRDTMSSESKIEFAKLDTLSEIRAAAKTNSILQNDLQKCIECIQHLLKEHIERLVLHNEPFQFYIPVDEIDIDEFFDMILLIDWTLKISETTSNILSKKKLQQFMQAHCRYRQYAFQPVHLSDGIFNSLDWLPDPTPSAINKDHYAEF
ncbi:15847_t:CDS:10, partial [Gigaspora rosea]